MTPLTLIDDPERSLQICIDEDECFYAFEDEECYVFEDEDLYQFEDQ